MKEEEAAESEAVVEVEPPLEHLILDKSVGKYQVVELISFRAKHLRTLEECRHLTQTEVLELAMREVLSGKLSEDELYQELLVAPSSVVKKDDKAAKKK
ncbi:MAG: hypothetical protein AUJ52_13840 [Elusimicrobia bacterium CG1_02_63_36]|nr:MAG: hypothetical protein AUJ52_13840 [Elusimicrobia bacterium CG1_02_63_36]